MEFFGIQKEQVPSMRLIRLEDEMTKFKPESNEFTEQSIKDFVSGVLSGKIKVNKIRKRKFVNDHLFLLFYSNIYFHKNYPKIGIKIQ